MRLYLIQTGEALSTETTDFGRPLSETGRLNIERLASLLSKTNIDAQKVIHSGNIRAQQTLEILRWAVTPTRRLVEARKGLDPQSPVDPWIEEISQWTDDAILVGHQPFIGKLVSRLITGREQPPVVRFVPGTAVCLETGAEGWSIAWMMPPEMIKGFA